MINVGAQLSVPLQMILEYGRTGLRTKNFTG